MTWKILSDSKMGRGLRRRGLTKAQKQTLEEGEAISFPTYGLGYIPDYGTRDGSESEAYESSTTEG